MLVCWGFLILYLSRLLPVTVPCQAGHRSLLIDSESFSGKLQLWPSDTGTRATTASPGREPSIKLPLCPDLYSLHVCVSERQCVFGGWALFGGGWGRTCLDHRLTARPGAPGVSVRERWIGLSPLANLSLETPEPLHHPHLLSHLSQNILLEGVHRPLCPSSPLSPLQRGAIWGEERCDHATNLFFWVALRCPCHSLPLLSKDGYLHGQGDSEFSFPAAIMDTDLDYRGFINYRPCLSGNLGRN